MRLLRLTLAVLAVTAFGISQETSSDQGAYRVGVGDVLKVEAFQHQEISGEFQVEEEGAISYPLLGHVPVSALSISEISRLLEEMLERDYYVDVQLQVEVAEYRSQPVTVLGEVQRPGTYYLKGKSTLTQVLSDAGGIRATAGPTVELRRLVGNSTNRSTEVLTFNTRDLLSGQEGTEFEIKTGDVISVSAKQLYFISGEVERPGQYEIARGLTLMQAISQAGGVTKFASQGVELHREAQGQEKQILTFDLSRIRKGKRPDEPIQAGDVIIIKRRFF
jgi:polysaccharide export outer membrane protein